jgi:glycine dehydrogenase
MAGMYAVYHGPDGLAAIARRVNGLATTFARVVESAGFKLQVDPGDFFDTVSINTNGNAKVPNAHLVSGIPSILLQT